MQEIEEFSKIAIFQTWNKFMIQQLLDTANIISLKRNNTIFKENNPLTYIYFIKQGEIRVTPIPIFQQF